MGPKSCRVKQNRPKEMMKNTQYACMCVAYSCKVKVFVESSLSLVSEVMLCTSGLGRLQDTEREKKPLLILV